MTMVLEIDQYSHALLPSGFLGYQQERVSRRCRNASNDNNYNLLRLLASVDKWLSRVYSVEHFPSFEPLISDYFPQYDNTSAAISTTGSIINVRRTSRRGRIGHPLSAGLAPARRTQPAERGATLASPGGNHETVAAVNIGCISAHANAGSQMVRGVTAGETARIPFLEAIALRSSQSIHVQRVVNGTPRFAARAKSYCGAVA